MAILLRSGNFVGYIGLALLIWVGIRLVRSGHRGGWLLTMGAGLVTFSSIFHMFINPLLVNPVHLTFSRTMITLVTVLPPLTLTFGFMFLALGLFIVAAREEKLKLASARHDSNL